MWPRWWRNWRASTPDAARNEKARPPGVPAGFFEIWDKDGLSLAVPVDLLTRIWELALEPRFSYEDGTTLVGYTAYPALD